MSKTCARWAASRNTCRSRSLPRGSGRWRSREFRRLPGSSPRTPLSKPCTIRNCPAPVVFGNCLGDAIKVLPQHNVLAHIRFDGIGPFIAHGLQSAPFILAVLGFGLAWLLYLHETKGPDIIRDRIKPIYNLLVRRHGLDR